MSEAVADTVVEESAAPETVEEVEAVETATEEQSEAQEAEEVLYAGKYKSAEELEKGYKEMQSLYNSRYKGFTGAPEDGEYTLQAAEGVDPEQLELAEDSPLVNKLRERGLEQGMSNDMFNGLVNDYIITQQEQMSEQIATEKANLGKDADVRIQNIIDRLNKDYPDNAERLQSAMINSDIVVFMEEMLNRDANSVAPADTEVQSADKESELNELWVAVDDRGRRKMEYDASYRNMVNKKFKEYYGD